MMKKRLKYLAEINMGQSPNQKDVNQEGIGIPFLQGKAEFGTFSPKPLNYCTNGNKRSKPGDILMSVRAPVGALNYSDQSYVIGRGLCSITTKFINDKYLWFALQEASDRLLTLVKGSTFESVTTEDVKNLEIETLNNLYEQEKVATFLSVKTNEVEQLINSKMKLINLLEEKRQALITEAVTKGLNPKVKMKDSGVEWIGEIPDNWSVIQFKRLSKRIEVGIAEAATHAYQDDGVPIIRSTNIKQGKIRQSDLLYINEDFAEKNKSKYIFANDLLTVRTGNAGLTGVVPENLNMSQCFTMLITTLKEKFNPHFYSYFLNANPGKMYFDITAWGTAQKNISVPILQEIRVPNLTIEEQHTIVTYLDKVNLEYDNLIADIQLQVNKLKEYRQSLIYEAVTGKIDVRDIEIHS